MYSEQNLNRNIDNWMKDLGHDDKDLKNSMNTEI